MNLADRVTSRLKLRDLRLLDTVVRQGTMAKAASQLNLTQPAVSKAIAEMEQLLGVRLIDRGRQGVEATPQGRALLRRGVAIFDELRQGVSEIEHISDPTAGELRIGAPEPMGAGLLPLVIERLSKQHPLVSFFVAQAAVGSARATVPQYQDLRERNVDLVLGPTWPAVGRDFERETLFKEPLRVAAGVRNPLTRHRNLKLSDLVDEPWCLPAPGTVAGIRCTEAFRASGLEWPTKAIASTSVQLQLGMLATGRFLTMFPNSLLHFSGERMGMKALPIDLKVPTLPVGIITLKNRTISPVARLFIEAARDITKPLSKIA
jgi:DNA-binding transcriptional LysR family regulator